MTCPPLASSISGNSIAGPAFDETPSPPLRVVEKPTPAIATNPLERLAQIMHSNDRLMDELATGRARIVRARAYLDAPGCNARFAAANLDRCRFRHAGVLARLRANRIEALRLLGEGGSDD